MLVVIKHVKNLRFGASAVTPVVKCLLSMCEVLSSTSTTTGKKKSEIWAEEGSSVVKHLPGMLKALGSKQFFRRVKEMY
jgi:hypothetical protein